MPKPNENESRDDFVARCMSDSESKKSFPDQKQRLAFCFSQFKKKSVNPKMITKVVNVHMPITKFWTETIKTSEGEVEQKFFEATISGTKEDRDGEVMDEKAIDGMVMQLKSATIPIFSDHGRDPMTGERAYSWKSIMGVWIDGRKEDTSLKAVGRLNGAHPDAQLAWKYLQEGIPISFSIGAKAIEVVEENVGEI